MDKLFVRSEKDVLILFVNLFGIDGVHPKAIYVRRI